MMLRWPLLLQVVVLVSLGGCWKKDKDTVKQTVQTTTPVQQEDAKLIVEITTEQDFEELLKNMTQVLVLKFDAPWCSACKYIQPHLIDAAKQASDLVFAKINIDTLPKIGQQYKIIGIPTILFFKEGKEISGSRLVGPEATNGNEMILLIRKAISGK